MSGCREDAELKRWKEERDAALLSLDRDKILAYCRRWGIRMPNFEPAFWAAVHKARTALRSLPMSARASSKRWLREHGLRSEDDGDVPEGKV